MVTGLREKRKKRKRIHMLMIGVFDAKWFILILSQPLGYTLFYSNGRLDYKNSTFLS